MTRPRRALLIATLLAATAGGVAACGEEGIDVPPEQRRRRRSSSTSAARAATRSARPAPRARRRSPDPRVQGRPELQPAARERTTDVLYAIRNGGFSSGPMPQNIVTGREAERSRASSRRTRRGPRPAGRTTGSARRRRGRTLPAARGVAWRDARRRASAVTRSRCSRRWRAGATAPTSGCGGARARRAGRAAAARGRGAARRPERSAGGAIARGQERPAATPRRRSPRCRASSARREALEPELSAVEAEHDAAAGDGPQPARPDRRGRATPTCARSARRRPRGPRPPRARRRHDRHGGAARRSPGSRFAYLKGDLVLLELALVRWALEVLRGHGFEPVIPPVLVREQALFGTGFLPDTEQQIYRLADDPLYPGRDQRGRRWRRCTPARSSTPTRCRCATPASRRASAARPAPPGRDTRGIFRVHQFDKVEMFSFVEPDAAADEHERLLAIEEEILQALGIPYRVVNIAVDDLGALGGQEVRLRGVAARPGALPRGHLDLEHDRLPGPPAGHPLSPVGGKPRTSTRSTARRSPSGAR